MADEPAQLNPSAPGQEPPMVSPPAPSSNSHNNDGDASNNSNTASGNPASASAPSPNSTSTSAASGRPRPSLRLHFNSATGGQICINGQTININRSGNSGNSNNNSSPALGGNSSNPNTNPPVRVGVARGSFGRAIHRHRGGIQGQAQRTATQSSNNNNNNSSTTTAAAAAQQNNQNANDTNNSQNQQPLRININGRVRVNGNAQVDTSNNQGRPTPMVQMMRPSSGLGPMLPPLEPQPVYVPNQSSDEHDSDTTTTSAAAEENGDEGTTEDDVKDTMKKFECAICFEYMDCPVGCGSPTCQTRYCHSCLNRVYRQETTNNNRRDPPQQQSTTDPNNINSHAKCPNCRSFFTLQSMAMDRTLQKQINDCTHTVTCPYKGCGKELRIGLLKSHEASCSYIRMRCRYSEWGCDWVGRKKDMGDHDEHECEFKGGLGKLVERFRQGDAQVGHRLQQHHMQIMGTSQMMALQSRQMMMMRGRNAGSVLDVMQMTYEVCLFPGRFGATKEMWNSLIREPAQYAVCNMMLMIPSLLLVFHVALRGFKTLPTLQNESLSGDDLWWVVDTLLLSVITTLLGILCIVCFFVDTKGPLDWTLYSIRDFIPGQPVLRDLAAICMAMLHFSSIEFSGMYIGILHWQIIAIVTCFFTSFVSYIVERNDSPQRTKGFLKMLTSARAWPVVVFGLRYGLLVAMCGISPSVNAVIIFRCLNLYLPKTGRHWLTPRNMLVGAGNLSDCFIKQLSTTSLIAIAGLCAVLDYQSDLAVSFVELLLDSTFAVVALAYVNVSVYLLLKIGIKLGESNFHTGNNIFMQAHRASGAVLPNIQPSPIGLAAFLGCSFLLACIAIA